MKRIYSILLNLYLILDNYAKRNSHKKKIYIFDSDLVWQMQLMIIKG